MNDQAIKIKVTNASHDAGSLQSLIHVQIDNDTGNIACGFLHAEFFKYVAFGHGHQPNPEKTMVPEPPPWVKERYPGMSTPAEFEAHVQRTIEVQQSKEFQSVVNHSYVKELEEKITGKTASAGYILSVKAGDAFDNIAAPSGSGLYILQRLFPADPDPWHYLKVSLANNQGEVLAWQIWTPW
ncbi:MAG: hypothetical protein OEZ39_15240 [Gammaproteobacteria bacterium]|nr:hypothetical protein [Gammaproteobacteria bacterium]MDH5653209.1 hypothetical protein [Gammaproteobacteria bacterium]